MSRGCAKVPGFLLAGALISAVLAMPAAAYTYMETAYGTPLTGLSSKGISMAGAMTAVPDGSFSLVQNPAMMAAEADRVADLTLRGIRYDETRYVPLWDSFDSYDKETAVAENPSSYTGLNGGLVFRPLKDSGLTIGGGFFERYNMQFNFVDERRSRSDDKVVATQSINSNHGIYSATGGVSYREKVLSVGAALHYYFGNVTFNNATVLGPSGTAADGPKRDFLARDMSGVGATFGVAAEVNDRVTLAASYNLPVTFNVDWRRETLTSTGMQTTIGSGDTKYPGRLALGVAYRPRNVLRTTFTLDVSRTYWEDLKDSVLTINPLIHSPSLRNTYEYRFGLEHIFYNDLPARVGFYYREAYAADEVDDAGITFGTAYRLQNFDVGIAGDISKRNSRQSTIAVRGASDPKIDRVQDSILRGAIDVRYRF